jgi:hypothetical protein
MTVVTFIDASADWKSSPIYPSCDGFQRGGAAVENAAARMVPTDAWRVFLRDD